MRKRYRVKPDAPLTGPDIPAWLQPEGVYERELLHRVPARPSLLIWLYNPDNDAESHPISVHLVDEVD